MPKLELGHPPKLAFREVGRNNATTFTGLCGKHDHELFKLIETVPIELNDLQHLFLLAYRAVLFEAHSSRKSAIDIQLSYLKAVEMGLYPKDDPSPPGLLAVEHMLMAYLVEEVKVRFEEAYLREDWNSIDHHVFCFESEPAVAVSSMFTTEIYSEFLDAAAYVTLNVFPLDQGTTAVVFSFIKQQRKEAEAAFGYIWNPEGHYQRYELSKLILRKCGNLAIAPDLFERFSERQKGTMAQYFIRNVGQQSFEMDDPSLYLFGPIN